MTELETELERCRLVDHENACLAGELKEMGKTVAHLSTEVGVLAATLVEAGKVLSAAASALYADIPADDIDALHATIMAMVAHIGTLSPASHV